MHLKKIHIRGKRVKLHGKKVHNKVHGGAIHHIKSKHAHMMGNITKLKDELKHLSIHKPKAKKRIHL